MSWAEDLINEPTIPTVRMGLPNTSALSTSPVPFQRSACILALLAAEEPSYGVLGSGSWLRLWPGNQTSPTPAHGTGT
jgi:hypothetical protein